MKDHLTVCPVCPNTKGAYGKPALVAVESSRLERSLGKLRVKCERCGSTFSIDVREQPAHG